MGPAEGEHRGRRKGVHKESNRVAGEGVTNHCRLRGGKGIGRWWNEKRGRMEDAECPRCRMEEETPDHIVFRCGLWLVI